MRYAIGHMNSLSIVTLISLFCPFPSIITFSAYCMFVPIVWLSFILQLEPTSLRIRLTTVKARSSAIAERPRDAPCQLKSCQLVHNCIKNRIWKDSQWLNEFVIKGHSCHRNWCYSIGHVYHFLLVVCSNNVSLLHLSPRIRSTTFRMYMTAFDIDKSFNSIRQFKLQLTSHVSFPVHVYTYHSIAGVRHPCWDAPQ